MTAEVIDHDTADQAEETQDGTPSWLAALCAELDPDSKRRLEALEPRADWRCLEIGAGSGTMASWLAERCPSGRVVATDVQTGFLSKLAGPNLEVLQHDVTTEDFPAGSFDLIYARYVFCHLRSREEDLARVASWLAPGGWLVLEDPARFPFESSPNEDYRKVSLATVEMYKERVGTDTQWSRSFPAPLARLGLERLGVDGSLSVVGGGRPMGQFWGEVVKAFGPDVVATGAVTEELINHVSDLMHRDDFSDLGMATVAAWGQRPA